MARTRLRTALAFVLLAGVLQVAPAAGDPQSNPNGPWEVPNQEETLKAIRDYDAADRHSREHRRTRGRRPPR